MLRKTLAIVAVLVIAGMTTSALASPFAAGNLVVERFDGNGVALAAVGTQVWLDEYTPTGTLVQSIAIPSVAGSYGSRLVNTGNSGAEGHVALSTNGQYLTLAGYDLALGTAVTTTSAWSTTNRVVGRVDWNGNVNTSTIMNGNGTGAPRSAVMDGNNIWVATHSSNLQYTTYGTTGASTTIGVTGTGTFQNARVAGIANGQLYASGATSAGPVYGVAQFGTGLPTTGSQPDPQLNGFPTAPSPTPSSYGFWFADASTLYVADDRTAGATGGGAQKWTLSGGLWTLQYTLFTGLTGGLREVIGSGSTLYAVSSDSKLWSVTDTGALSSFTSIAAAGTFQAFKGVAFAPTPEPGTLMLLCLGGVALLRRR